MLNFKRNLLSTALASAILLLATGAQAESAGQAAASPDQTSSTDQAKDANSTKDAADKQQQKKQKEAKLLNVVSVTGYAASVENSIATKRDNSSIVEVVTAEDIGKLPDVSIADAIGRLPGITAQRVNGRNQVISIRGLGPDLSTALLNGREQVSTGDNRGVEFDQYPAELLGSVVVYKTPDSTILGQGLAGTVDLRTIRPLDQNKRVLTANARYEFNNEGALNPDTHKDGYRASATYIDQFFDHKLGITFGVAAQSTPTQTQQFNSWGFPTVTTPDGSQAFVIGGSKDYVSSDKLDRVAALGTIEYKPSDFFHSTLDMSYSDFKEHQVLRGIEFPLQWSSAQLRPGYTVVNGFVTNGVFDGVKAVMRNDLNYRKAKLYNYGWNNKFRFNDLWSAESDVSFSRAIRNDLALETYSGTGPGALGLGATDSLGFSQRPNGLYTFSPTLNYGDASQFMLTDPQGWGAGNHVTQAGFINNPVTRDALTSLRLSVERTFVSGPISSVELGANESVRNKNRRFNQAFLTPLNGATSEPYPAGFLESNQAALSFLGIGPQVTYNPLSLLDSGAFTLVPVALSSVSVPQDWKVHEGVTTGYVKFNVDTNLWSIPVTGNFGLQMVYTDQVGHGSRVAAGSASAGSSTVQFIPVVDGAKYKRYLPSLNLSFDITESTKVRFGLARTLARARMDQLNPSLSLSTDLTHLTSTDPNQSAFSAGGGNAHLKPTMADGVDLSLEQYFDDGKGYVSLGGFYKHLSDFVNPNDAFLFDFSNFISSALTPAQAAQLGTPLGIVSGPTNRGSGHIKGLETSFTLPLEVFTPMLTGFGVQSSGSYTASSIVLGDDPRPITVPGLSKWVIHNTVYYDLNGFSFRVNHNYRDNFLGEVQGISSTRILRTVKGGHTYDAQISYEFQNGRFKGLTLMAQANNLTNEAFVTFQNGDPRQVIDHQTFGRTYLIGASYKFF